MVSIVACMAYQCPIGECIITKRIRGNALGGYYRSGDFNLSDGEEERGGGVIKYSTGSSHRKWFPNEQTR